jgi:hypothetical protein
VIRRIRADRVRVGDLAHRVDGSLDARPVASVDHAAKPRTITLKIGTIETPSIPASWYRFTRDEVDS